ncbi:tetratricopeptide repeat protein [Anaeromyxobacter terrae]|uniref:tetratricopeptide repeat protein n=1 Tax=Anaeromyxobacter terrae TaxID=2925406 RepID=UPI001F574B18|nr:tetratricopeptide repeat protein [Anaeromyxobacter sp. SG22]
MTSRGCLHARAVFASFAVLASLGARAVEAPRLAWVAIEGGVYEVGGAEYYLDAYRIQARATQGEYEHDVCEAPRPEEWLVAARQRGFTVGNAFEYLAEPPEEPCAYSAESLEAEGVEGWVHFAGLGEHLGAETKVVAGGKEPRETWVKVHQNPWSFWGDEYKPSPRAWRCVERVTPRREKAFVQASRLKLRARRATDGAVLADVRIGTEVAIAHRAGNWVWVEAPGHGVVMECVRRGWAMAAFLGPEKPDADALLAEGRKLLDEGDAALAVPRLERAAALRPEDRAILQLLARAHRKAGNAREADELERYLAKPADRRKP